MSNTISVLDLGGFDAAFSDVGTHVRGRTGPDKRTQDSKEWFVVRHVLKAGLRAGFFTAPFSIQKQNPPAPDFMLNNDDHVAFIEITEATHPDDQREMTRFERSGEEVMLLGDYGGTFTGGASQPGIAWTSDILDGIRRKKGKSIYLPSPPDRHLIIYPSSNASTLLFDAADERTAFRYLFNAVADERDAYLQMVNGCLVHVLGKEYVLFDLLGKAKRVKRH